MKSFKLISLQLVTEDRQLIDIELEHGLIINKESHSNSWMIEALVHPTHYQDLEHILPCDRNHIVIQVVITDVGNDPAIFQTVLTTHSLSDGHVSLLFDGQIQNTRNKYAEILLADLLQKGFTGDSLLNAFKENLRSKRKLAAK